MTIRSKETILMDNRGVSIIICCYNSSKKLPETLTHLSKQIIPKGCAAEIIIVDNNSTDNTSNFALKVWNELNRKDIQLKVIVELSAGLNKARMAGTASAKYDYILFCDDDNWLPNDYVKNAIKNLEMYPSLGIVGAANVHGKYEIKPPKWFLEFKEFCCIYEEGNMDKIDLKGDQSIFVPGAGMFIYKKIILEYFDNENKNNMILDRVEDNLFSGGDTDINLFNFEKGYGIGIFSDMRFTHFIPKERIKKKYLKKMAYCQSFSSVIVATKNNLSLSRWSTSGILKYYFTLLLKGSFFKIQIAYLQTKGANDAFNHLKKAQSLNVL